MTTEVNTITHIWERFNIKWIIVGALSGAFAGLVMLAAGSYLAAEHLGAWDQSLKLLAAIRFGGDALSFDSGTSVLLYGALIHFSLSLLYGVTYAQLVNEKSKSISLIVIGFVTSLIIWVFGCQLFMPSFNYFLLANMTTAVGFGLHILFGISFGIFASLFRGVLLRKS